MGLSKKAFFIGVVMAFHSSFVAALGLGEIKLNSALNQPLDAEIELLHVRDLTERDIIISLATAEDFERASVDRIYFLTSLKFKIDLNAKGGPVVRVSTSDPVMEPFLDFIVSAQWPSGKLLREYTLLVDLPIYTNVKPAPVRGAETTSVAGPTVQTPASRPTTSRPSQIAPAARPVAERTAYSGEEYGPVSSSDTLWNIASRIRPDSDVSVQQTMLAIQRLNPEAFINNNINLLRRGQILRVPDKDEIMATAAREAIRDVAAQNRAWSQGDKVSTDKSAQLEGSKSLSPGKVKTDKLEGRIKLSTVEASDSEEGSGSGKSDQGTSAIESQLMATQEELDAASRESAELRSRIQSMEEQIKTMEKLLEVSNDEMRSIELAAQQIEQTKQVEEQPETQTAAGTEPAETETSATTSVATLEPTSAVEQPAAVEPVKTEPVKPVTQSKQEYIMGLVQDNLLYIAGGIGGLVILLAAFLLMRKRDDTYGEDDFDDDFDQIRSDFEAPQQSLEEDDTFEIVDLEPSVDDEIEEEVAEETQAEAETEDVVGECDIHIAYGQYDQAEDKLIRALEKEPRNVAARMKLLEVFAAQNDVDGFDSQYAKIRVLGDAEAVDRAEILRNSIEGISAFNDGDHDVSGFLAKINEDYDSTDFSDVTETKQNENISNDFDFTDDTLKFDFEDNDARDGLEESDDFAGQSDELDFDLDLDDQTQVTKSRSGEAIDNLDETFDELDSELEAIEFDLEDANSLASDEIVEEDDLGFELGDLDDEPSGLQKSAAGNFDVDFAGLDDELDEDRTVVSGRSSAAELDAELNDDFADLGSFETDETGDFSSEFELGDLDAEDESSVRSGSSDSDIALDFDLDKDLEDAIASEDQGETGHSGIELAGDGDLDFGDLADLDIDSELEITSAEEDLDFDLEGGLEQDPLSGVAEAKGGAESFDNLDSANDFDVDFDLQDEVNLEDLDNELGDFDLGVEEDEIDKIAAGVSAGDGPVAMEEPVVDFDDALDDEIEEPEVELIAEDPLVELEDQPVAATAREETATESHSMDFEIPDFDPENDDDSNLEFLSDNDETATKLDLARAYIDMGDAEGAKDILDEIVEEGSDQQKKEAETLLAKLA